MDYYLSTLSQFRTIMSMLVVVLECAAVARRYCTDMSVYCILATSCILAAFCILAASCILAALLMPVRLPLSLQFTTQQY
jgi:hypothetical protein